MIDTAYCRAMTRYNRWMNAALYAICAELAPAERTRDRGLQNWLLVVHLFDHQIPHRGQLTTLLSQLGRDPGATELHKLPGLAELLGNGA